MQLSVVMAVRNGGRYLRQALDSVLSQSVTDFEFLIVDDGSSDGTADILGEYRNRDSRVRLLRNEKSVGPYPSANRALAEARGTIIARHDGDDVSPPDRFAVQLAAFAADPETSLVTGAVEVVDQHGASTRVFRPPSWQPRLEWELLFGNAVGAGGHVMFPRVLLGTPVKFPAACLYAEDYGLWCTLSRLGRVVCPRHVVYRYRQHGSSITTRARAAQHSCFSRIRYEHQSRYVSTSVARETLDELSRFWTAGGGRPLAATVPAIQSALTELKANFLAEIDRRHGHDERVALEAEIEQTLNDRLAYWLYRSIRFFDPKSCRDLFSMARARNAAVDVAGKAAAKAVRASLGKALSRQS